MDTEQSFNILLLQCFKGLTEFMQTSKTVILISLSAVIVKYSDILN